MPNMITECSQFGERMGMSIKTVIVQVFGWFETSI